MKRLKRAWFHIVTLFKLSWLVVRCGFNLKTVQEKLDQEVIEAKAKLAEKWRCEAGTNRDPL